RVLLAPRRSAGLVTPHGIMGGPMSVNDNPDGILLGRALLPGFEYPRIVTVRDGQLTDITARGMATVRDIAESGRAAEHVRTAPGRAVGDIAAVVANSKARGN